ncbi:MAG TPA: DUF6492 family protein [Anaeromyxobacter sp.]|nr:DUF6492 family protein [Anaeromyxobacter sp.]
MAHVVIVTPSFRFDLERCELLAEGVARFAAKEFRQVVIVPRMELGLFRDRVGRFGATVLPEEELLPSWLLRLPFSRKWQLSPRGWPVRGWIRQQVMKIAFACHSTADALLFADSDTCIVRPVDGSLLFRPGGRVRLIADPADGNVPTHHAWYQGAGRLLGLPPEDYSGFGFIGNLVPWVPDVARSMVWRLQEVNGVDWRWLLLHQRTLSEYVLYGVFVQKVLGFDAARHLPEAHKQVLETWTDQLSDEGLVRFFSTIGPQHVAVHVQSKVRYSLSLYARAIRSVWESGSAATQEAGSASTDG